jgi:hypothetical protein
MRWQKTAQSDPPLMASDNMPMRAESSPADEALVRPLVTRPLSVTTQNEQHKGQPVTGVTSTLVALRRRMVGVSNEPHWTEPGAYPVADGIHRIPLPLPMDGLKAVNVYVLETEGGLTCVDGGWALEVSRGQFEESLRLIGHHPRDITSFLVTHAHGDHYTQASAIRTEFGRATVALGAKDKPTLDLIHSELEEHPFLSRLRACGAFELAHGWADHVSDGNPCPPRPAVDAGPAHPRRRGRRRGLPPGEHARGLSPSGRRFGVAARNARDQQSDQAASSALPARTPKPDV